MSDFDTSLNVGYHEAVQDTQSTLVSDVAGGVVATVVDAGASIWNSLPGTTEVSTSDLLSGISDNALRVYEEHPDLIHAASFIGSSFVPMGLALKGMNAMRNGSKAVNWFSKLGKEEDLARVGQLFKAGAEGTKEYRSAVRGMYAKTAVNQAVDAVAAETAVLATLNASPMLEDYWKDPVTNFGISVAFGGVLGGALGSVADHYATRALTSGITEEALSGILTKVKNLSPDMPNGVAMQVSKSNLDSLDTIIAAGAAAGKTADNDITISMASKMRTQASAEIDDLFKTIISPEIDALPLANKERIKEAMMNSPEMFGVEKVSYASASDVSDAIRMKLPKDDLSATPTLAKVSSGAGPIEPQGQTAVFFQDLGLYGNLADMKHYAGAATLYGKAEEVVATLGKNVGKYADHDTGLVLAQRSAANVQADYIGKMKIVADMPLEDFAKLKVAPTDTAMLTAVRARMLSDPEAAKLSVKLEDGTAYAAAIQREKLPDPHTYDFAQADTIDRFSPAVDSGLPRAAHKLWTGWVGGSGIQDLRRGAAEFFRKGFAEYAHQSPEQVALGQQFGELYNSTNSKALRAEFSKVADAEGYIYLYRGTRSLKDRSAVRSYSTVEDKAAEFGKPRLYQVHVDDVVAGFNDIPGKAGTRRPEVIVVEGERRPATLSDTGRLDLQINASSTGVDAQISDISKALATSKSAEISDLMAQGVPLESIAIKTNTDLDTLQSFIFSSNVNAGGLVDAGETAIKQGRNDFGNVLNSAQDIEKILSPDMKPLVLQGNVRKPQYSAASAGLDARTLGNINSVLTDATLRASGNSFARDLSDLLYSPGHESGSMRYALDMIKASLGKGNNQAAGNAFFNSFDFFSRNMGDLGPQISHIGKRINHMTNKYIDQINKPISDAMSKVSAKVEDTIEFNTFREVNAGLAGWRQFKEGHLWQKVESVGADGKPVMTLEKVLYNGVPYEVKTESVTAAIEVMQKNSSDLLSLMNVNRRVQGMTDVSDIGLWVPSFNPTNKFIAYVHEAATDNTQILWANSKPEYLQLVRDFKQKLAANGQDSQFRVVEKGAKGVEQKEWSRLNGRMDTLNMKVADSSMLKGGSSASALVRSDTQVFGEIAGGYEHFINSQVRTMADLAMYDVTEPLRAMSSVNQWAASGQPLSGVKRFLSGDKDAATTLRNTLLGSPNLGEYEGWKSINQSFETGLSFASNTVSKIWDASVAPLTKTLLGGTKKLDAGALRKLDYEAVAKKLEDAGIVNPWAAFDKEAASMYGLSRLEDSPDTSKRIIFASNALAATMALRIGELAQPLVNIMSLPILTGLATANKMPETFMGVAKGTAKVSGTQVMYEGARAANSPQWAHFDQKWRDAGFFDGMVSEATKTLGAARSMNRGAVEKIERALDSSFVNIMSKPADWSEAFVRRQTMYTGAVLAKRLYPELGDEGVTIFARDFMDKAVGNFHASQRPVMFQGTLGVALGLFQTYSLTMGQNIYRHLELKNYKALGAASLTQSGIFGIGSMPGFQGVSTAIGEHFSDDHVDLTTGSYRALPDKMASTMLYGLPSLAGIGTHTRGDTSFRVPGLSGDNIVALNFAKQATQAIGTVASQMDTNPGKAGMAMLQALSLQNMSRPLARAAELATGYSVTRQGNTVQTPEEVWTTTGIIARALATRPVEEIQLRDAMHLKSYYGAIDRDNRTAMMTKLKNGIRNGTLDDKDVERISGEYMRNGGSPTGWRSALRTALATTETAGREVFVDKLKPNQPFNHMLDNL